jgi:hypothetical protein
MPKTNFRVKNLWEQLQNLIIPLDSEDQVNLLNVLKTWIESNRKILQQGNLDKREALSLLLEGKAAEFAISKPEASQYLRELVTSDLFPPKTIEDIVNTLEIAVREFAVFTKWEDCPVCQEGYLGYWIDIGKNKIVLSCPECGWEDLQEEEWTGEAKLFPALIPELKAHHIIAEHGQHA